MHYTPGYNPAMPLTCNIDAKGKRVRLISGIVVSFIGIVLMLAWALPIGGQVPWTVAIVTLVFGAFQIFEARAGWCVVRAMGFKTRV